MYVFCWPVLTASWSCFSIKLLCFTRNETKVHWQSKFLLSLSLQVVLYLSGAFSDKLSLMFPRIWPIADICIGLYVLKRLLTVWHILEKVMSTQHSFEAFSEKQRRVELKSVGNFVAETVLVESANLFSLKKLCRTQYSLKYFFRSHIDDQTYGKTLTQYKSNINTSHISCLRKISPCREPVKCRQINVINFDI